MILLYINSNSQPCSKKTDWTFYAPRYPVNMIKITGDDKSLLFTLNTPSFDNFLILKDLELK